jgi:hypothetical protein
MHSINFLSTKTYSKYRNLLLLFDSQVTGAYCVMMAVQLPNDLGLRAGGSCVPRLQAGVKVLRLLLSRKKPHAVSAPGWSTEQQDTFSCSLTSKNRFSSELHWQFIPSLSLRSNSEFKKTWPLSKVKLLHSSSGA